VRLRAGVLFALVFGACGDEVVPASEIGARLVADPSLSPSPLNAFSCATCHPVRPTAPDGGPIFPGGNLYNVVHRPTWWGGGMTRLLDAMNYCLVEFMGGAALAADDERARAVYEYLVSVSPDDPSPALPLTVVKNVTDLAELAGSADARRGADVWQRGCRGCHGSPHSGAGRLGEKTTIVPEDTLAGPVCAPAPDVRGCARAVVVEKVRHGKFFNIGGLMPLYGTEVIRDTEIADVLAYLGL
jgi:thiosulfate dehydrogenase